MHKNDITDVLNTLYQYIYMYVYVYIHIRSTFCHHHTVLQLQIAKKPTVPATAAETRSRINVVSQEDFTK